MKGYIIQSVTGSYLSHPLANGQYVWLEHEHPQEAYVHPLGLFPQILEQSQFWEVRPLCAFPARFENGVVTIVGEAINFPAFM